MPRPLSDISERWKRDYDVRSLLKTNNGIFLKMLVTCLLYEVPVTFRESQYGSLKFNLFCHRAENFVGHPAIYVFFRGTPSPYRD